MCAEGARLSWITEWSHRSLDCIPQGHQFIHVTAPACPHDARFAEIRKAAHSRDTEHKRGATYHDLRYCLLYGWLVISAGISDEFQGEVCVFQRYPTHRILMV